MRASSIVSGESASEARDLECIMRMLASAELMRGVYHVAEVFMLRKSRRFHLTATTALGLLLLAPAVVFAQQSPWERAASNLERTFTGPLARSLALVAIVIGGLMFMYGEAGAKRQISGIVFGGALALFAAQFLVWLF
jgi:type IV secretory pathway VirB2 component (pilin)